MAAADLKPGDALPSVRNLARRLRVNPATVGLVYRELDAEGFVEMRQGAGTFVREVVPERRASVRTRLAAGLGRPLLVEACRLGLSTKELLLAISQELVGKVS